MQARRRTLVVVTLLGVCVAGATTTAFQRSPGEPTQLRPQPGRKDAAVSLPRGEVLLLEFLQRLADATGETVCLGGSEPPQAALDLPRALDALDLKVAREVLERNGFDLSRETYREKSVYWVQRSLVPPGRKGKILRPGEEDEGAVDKGAAPKTPVVKKPAAKVPAISAAGRPRLYRIDEGQVEDGAGPRYIVILETNSRKEAEDAVLLLKARRPLR